MRQRHGASLEQLLLAQYLRQMRKDAGVELSEAARALGASTSTVRRIELAKVSFDRHQVETLVRYYKCPADEVEQILTRLDAANAPGWWHPWGDVMPKWLKTVMPVEAASRIVRVWHPSLVPELLRTAEYARALDELKYPKSTAAERELRVSLLRERQRQLHERHAFIWAVFPAAALHTVVGSPEVMGAQMRTLHRAIHCRNEGVTVQVVPLDAPAHQLSSSPPVTLYRVQTGVQDHAVLERPVEPAEVTDSEDVVSSVREALEHATVAAPRANTPLPSSPFTA